MWPSLWQSVDKYSLQHFKYVVNELRRITVVDMHNREKVVDLLRSIVEIVTYGDRQDPLIFECFMEFQVLAEFVRVLKISRKSRIEAPLLQYLSILIQNINREHAIYYCFSGEYINDIITHPFEFCSEDLASYYVSFLRAVSSKLNSDMLCLLVKVHGDAVVSFPLYCEAIKFAHHGEKMIQAAVRALTLNVYTVGDDMVYEFITTPPISEYFSKLVHNFNKQCVQIDGLVHPVRETLYDRRRDEILLETEKIVDDLYYFKDILTFDEPRLTRVVTQNLLGLLVFPILFPLLQLRPTQDSTISHVTSLYVISRLLQVVGGKYMINAVSGVIMHPYMSLSIKNATNGDTTFKTKHSNSWVSILSDLEIRGWSGPEFEEAEKLNGNGMFGHFLDTISSHSHVVNGHGNDDASLVRIGILSHVFSDNRSTSLASLFLLFILAESKDLDNLHNSAIESSHMPGSMSSSISYIPRPEGGILERFTPQILHVLLKGLASQTLLPAQTLWHTGWLLLKLLALQRMKFDDENFCLFNTSYKQSQECLWKELDKCWFDHIPETVLKEWFSCKSVLNEKSQSKDPVFVLEISALQKMTDGGTSYFAWQRMVDAVKVFILHIQVKAYITNRHFLEQPLLNLTSNPTADSGRTHRSNLSSASFGSEVSLACGVCCSIAFSSTGIRDVCLIPVADGASGKLILAEKHRFRSQRGVVIAIAPLAGLSPKIDEEHPTWMHLRIREFVSRICTSKSRGRASDAKNIPADGRWTVGFSSNEACEAARLLILEETAKQRSYVEKILSPLVQSDYLVNRRDGKGKWL